MSSVHSPQDVPPSTLYEVVKLLRWNKPEGRLILMIPALWALFLATDSKPPWILVLVMIFGTLATSAAGCIVNDLWDRNIDPKVERTKTRPLAARTLTIRVGLVAAFFSFLCALGLALYLTPLSFGFCVAAVPVIILYPLTKRVFPVPQLVLSIAWGFAVLISWTAAVNKIELGTLLLWGATVLWTLGFDTIYAMPDRPDDKRLGINSSALFFGDWAAIAIGLCFVGTFGLFLALGLVEQLHWSYWIALGLSGGLWSLQSLRLRQDPLPVHYYARYFRQNVTAGFVLLIGIIGGKLL